MRIIVRRKMMRLKEIRKLSRSLLKLIESKKRSENLNDTILITSDMIK